MIQLIATIVVAILVCMPIVYAYFTLRAREKFIEELRQQLEKWDEEDKNEANKNNNTKP
jgi:Na+/melibiose symporter-like transporter